MNRAFFATAYANGARQLSAPCDTRELAIAYAGAEEWDISQTAIIGPVPIDYLERAPKEEPKMEFMLIAWAPETTVLGTGSLAEMKERMEDEIHSETPERNGDWLSIIPCVCTELSVP